jgi:beta-fructofuranosidase
MVHGGNLNKAKGGQAVVSLYEAENPELTKWKYRSILFQHSDPKVVNIECPLFFPLDGKFVLITSPHRACDYFIGTFDPEGGKFTFESQGMLDHSGQFYAPNCLEDAQGRRILWGWIRGFPERKGWNGCLSLPRVLSIKDGRLVQTPAPELAKLRGPELGDGLSGEQLEIEFVWDGKQDLPLLDMFKARNGQLELFGAKISMPSTSERTKFRIFADRSVVEVFLNDGQEAITRVTKLKEVSSTAKMVSDWKAWELKSIW